MSGVPFAGALPLPAKGYAWVNCTETKSAFLKPEGWFFKKGKQGDIHGYIISRTEKEGCSTREFLMEWLKIHDEQKEEIHGKRTLCGKYPLRGHGI
jgi:hypothetical protein